MVFVLMLTIAGRLVFITGAALTCSGSPFCIPTTSLGWLKFVHLALAGISAILVFWLFLKAWREQRDEPVLLPLTTVTVVLFLAGLCRCRSGRAEFSNEFGGLHTVTAVSLWIALLALAVISGLSAQDGKQFPKVDFRQRAGDFFILSKP